MLFKAFCWCSPRSKQASKPAGVAGALTGVCVLGHGHGKGAPLLLEELGAHHALQHNQRSHERLQRRRTRSE